MCKVIASFKKRFYWIYLKKYDILNLLEEINNMNKQEILKYVDHTLLSQTSTWKEIKQICDEGIKYNTASICIPPVFVKHAKEL